MMKEKDLTLFTQALKFASFEHRHRKKKSSDIPQINHLIEVVDILAKAGVTDFEILSAAVLHDTIENCGTKPQQLQKHFGERVKNLVLECTDNTSLQYVKQKKNQILKSKTATPEAKLIKIADKLSNCQAVSKKLPPHWSQLRLSTYFVWAHAVCRGLRGVNQKLDAEMDRLWKELNVFGLDPEVEEAKLKEYYKILEEVKDQK